jgi:LysR family glycine cleavage system transcriptional activator
MPPLNALRAFEAAARLLSFKQAAEELFVTPAALSHQIKALEDHFGQPLFVRKTRAVALTPAGEALYPGLRLAFEEIRRSVEHLSRLPNDGVLVVSASPGFTAKWLAPRLWRFMQASPDIETRVSASFGLANFVTDGVDIAIRNSRRPTTGLWARPLVPISLLPVMSPKMAERHGIATPADLARVALIHDDMLGGVTGTPRWPDWFAAAGVSDRHTGGDLRFTSPDHALDAAVEGAGALLAHYAMAYDDLRTGRLVAPFGPHLRTPHFYQLVAPEAHVRRPKVRAFIDWVLAEAECLVPLDHVPMD